MGDYKAQRKASAIDGQNIKWNWGARSTTAFREIRNGVQGRPLSKIFSILDLLDELNHGSYCRRPRPGKPGGKPLAATQDEKEMEVDRRKEAQKACQRLIVPRQPKEDADVFLRRLDAHRNAPEQLFAPQMPGEEPMQACKRLIAGKKNETAGVLLFPKSSHETNKEYEERLAVAESSRVPRCCRRGRRRTRRPSATRCARSPSAACRSCRARTTRRTTSSSCASTWRRCAPTSSTRTTRRARTTTSAPTAPRTEGVDGLALEPGHPRFNERDRRWCTRRRRWSRR